MDKFPVAVGELRKHMVAEVGAYLFAKEVDKEGYETKEGNGTFLILHDS